MTTKRGPGRPKAPERKFPLMQLLDRIKEREEARENLIGFIKGRDVEDKGGWRGLLATPPGSLLETVIRTFDKNTDIPLEIPFITTVSLVAGVMLKRNNSVLFGGANVRPDLWTILLASSGSGKTFASTAIQKMSGFDSDFPEAASSAAFVEALSKNNRGVWVRDEIGQFIKNIESIQHLAEMKDYLLRVADGKRIERSTKKERIVIDDPSLVILGLTVLETFGNVVPPEMLLDGFAQRFNVLIAERDQRKDPRDYAIYDLSHSKDRISKEFEEIQATIKENTQFELLDRAEDAFRTSFGMLYKDDLPMSFFRRVMFRGMKYAMVYHALLKKESTKIDEFDIGWGARLSALHLKDASKILIDHGIPDLEKLIRSAERIKESLARDGKVVSARDIVQGVYGIKSTAEARGILSLI
jgi:uncharacterized protein YlxP (DUF503 family)